MFLRDDSRDLLVFARSLWIVSRYWMNYLAEMEGLDTSAHGETGYNI